MISMLRKEACSGSTHDLAHISIQNCLADCLPKSSAEADTLITAMKKRSFLEVDVHPNFRILMEYKALLVCMVQIIHAHKGEKCFLPERLKDFLFHQLHEKDHAMWCLLKTSMDSESQDATKMTSALADSRIYSYMNMMTLYMCIVAVAIFLSVSLSFSSNVVTISTSMPTGVCRINRWTKKTQCWSGIWRRGCETRRIHRCNWSRRF